MDLNPGKNGHDRRFRSLFASSSGFWCWHFSWSKWNQGCNPSIDAISFGKACYSLQYVAHFSSNLKTNYLNHIRAEGRSINRQKDDNPICRSQAKKILYASNGINSFTEDFLFHLPVPGPEFAASWFITTNCFHASLRLELDYLCSNRLVELMVFYSIQVPFLKLLVCTSPCYFQSLKN